ncbi:phosphatase PAP2 family protein [Streptomyces sp. GZWMJZ-114]|uniref:phosphatase PAP2 family protein n=1 Tax=Streptomyces sp. GZWMJZ-114 TaxID=2494734 RepID=UPI0010117EFF|nr:phosphatase PAP2 family protein [Streptomyces sp. GZWMJZ-114]
MTATAHLGLALDGAAIDGPLYADVTDFARHTRWLNAAVFAYTSYGVATFVILMLIGWWYARHRDSRTMAASLASPIAMVLAYAVNSGFKNALHEPRPCRAMPQSFRIEACPPMNDWSFPSNHTTVAFAATAALFLVDRRLGFVSLLAALLMAGSRVYVGAHYPHDVVAAAVMGTATGLLTALMLRRLGTASVDRVRSTRTLGPLLTG